MTVIVFDGISLAADKRGTDCGYATTVTKIHRVPGGAVGFSGDGAHAAALLEWFQLGRPKGQFPKVADVDDAAGSLFITDRGEIFSYSWRSENPQIIEDKFFARGAGRDYALAALYLGHDARRAVEVACALETSCGNGIDVIRVVR